jgi:hypothetical protein
VSSEEKRDKKNERSVLEGEIMNDLEELKDKRHYTYKNDRNVNLSSITVAQQALSAY